MRCAKEIGMSRSAIARFDLGHEPIKPSTIDKLLEFTRADAIIFYQNSNGGLVWELYFEGTNWRLPDEKTPDIINKEKLRCQSAGHIHGFCNCSSSDNSDIPSRVGNG